MNEEEVKIRMDDESSEAINIAGAMEGFVIVNQFFAMDDANIQSEATTIPFGCIYGPPPVEPDEDLIIIDEPIECVYGPPVPEEESIIDPEDEPFLCIYGPPEPEIFPDNYDPATDFE